MVGTAITGRPEVSAIALPKPMVEPPPITTQQSAPSDAASRRASSASSTGVCITTLSNTPATKCFRELDTTSAILARPGVEIARTRFAPRRPTSAASCATEPGPNTTREGSPV